MLFHTLDSNLQHSDPESMGRVATPGGDLINDHLGDLLTFCAGTLRTMHSLCIKLVTIKLSQLVILYLSGSW